MATKQVVEVDGKQLQISNLDKVLWPRLGLTKATLLEYHAQVSAVTSAHWQGRNLTVTRYPHGVEGDFFYQKNTPASAPPWIKVHRIEETDYVVAEGLATTTWLANSGAIEFHPSTYLISSPDTPSYAMIDLDPTEPQGFSEAVEIAKYCRDILEELRLTGYPKLSGATGIHIYIPLQGRYDFNVTSQLVKTIGMKLQRLYPQNVTLERLIKNRRGVYVDFLQNHQSRTLVGVYSPRPTPEATVSTPVTWSDLDYYEPRDFTVLTVPNWIKERGDLFGPLRTQVQSLEHLIFSPLRS